MKRSLPGKVAAGAASAGVLALLFYKTKDRLGPKPVNVTVELQSTDMNALSQNCREAWENRRDECLKGIDEKADRQAAALLLDGEERGMELLGLVQPEAEVLSSNVTDSFLRKLADFLLSPVISFLLALAATGFLIAVKWQMEAASASEAAVLLNPVILLSAAASVHLLLNTVHTLVKNNPARSKKVKVGVKLTMPEERKELFMSSELKRVKEDTEQLHRTYAAPSKTDDPTMTLLSETYGDLCQAEATEDMTDVFGYIKPKCAVALRKMDVDIVENYTPETAHLFTVIEAPGYGKSMVAKPAMVLKNSGRVLARGEYVKNT